jgi:hypothetical protein
MRVLLLITAVALAASGAAACGTHSRVGSGGGSTVNRTTSAGAVGATATATATAPPSSRPSVLTGPQALTIADNGATVRLRRGQSLTVVLDSQSIMSWHVPSVDGVALTPVSASGGYPARTPAQATFLAVRPGGATLQAIDDIACLHVRPPCLPPQQTWKVTVVVVDG